MSSATCLACGGSGKVFPEDGYRAGEPYNEAPYQWPDWMQDQWPSPDKCRECCCVWCDKPVDLGACEFLPSREAVCLECLAEDMHKSYQANYPNGGPR